MRALITLLVLSAPAQADTVLSPAEFEAFAQGSTVYFSRHGQPFGAEQYLRNQRVIWQFTDGTCEFGEWFTSGDQLCFQYEHQSDALCWNFLETKAGKAVRVVGDDPANDLLVSGQDQEHLKCEAPNVGASYAPYSSKSEPWLAAFGDVFGLEAPANFSLPSLN
jgi:hypothetical protein